MPNQRRSKIFPGFQATGTAAATTVATAITATEQEAAGEDLAVGAGMAAGELTADRAEAAAGVWRVLVVEHERPQGSEAPPDDECDIVSLPTYLDCDLHLCA